MAQASARIVRRQCARCHREHRLWRQHGYGPHQRRRHRDGHHRRRGHRHDSQASRPTRRTAPPPSIRPQRDGRHRWYPAFGAGSGLIDINHTAGTIAAGSIAIDAIQAGSGTIDISQTGGALNGPPAVSRLDDGQRQLIVSLTGGTVGNVSGRSRGLDVWHDTVDGDHSGVASRRRPRTINATAVTSGNIAITNNATVTGAINAVSGSTSGTFGVFNTGTINGEVSVTGSNATSTFANLGTWMPAPALAFSGRLGNSGTVNLQNGVAGQVIAVGGNYNGGGVYRVDVDAAGNADRMNAGGTAKLTGGTVNALFLPGAYVMRNYTIFSATGGLGNTTFTAG